MLCLFFPDCLEQTRAGRHMCDHHVHVYAVEMGFSSPALLQRCWIPDPSLEVALAKLWGTGGGGLSREQVGML